MNNNIKKEIIKYLQPKTPSFYTRANINEITKFEETFLPELIPELIPESIPESADNRKREEYLKTYKQYLDNYEAYQGTPWGNEITDYHGNPVLLDLMTTGLELPFIKPTRKYWRDEYADDVREIIRLFPDSVHCDMGYARCRSNLTPLYFASLNNDIPIEVVEILLQNGANPNHEIDINCGKVPILADWGLETYAFRLNDVHDLFKKYQPKQAS